MKQCYFETEVSFMDLRRVVFWACAFARLDKIKVSFVHNKKVVVCGPNTKPESKLKAINRTKKKLTAADMEKIWEICKANSSPWYAMTIDGDVIQLTRGPEEVSVEPA